MQKPIQMAVTLRQAGAIRRTIWGQKKDQKRTKKRANIHHTETKPGLVKKDK
jgi:hypothetical protein